MKRSMKVGLGVCGLCVLLVAAVAPAGAWQVSPQPFTSDMAVSTPHGNMTGKFYFSAPKMRMDINSKGHDASMIMDSQTQVSLVLMPQQHMYMEMHADQNNSMMPHMPKIDTSIDPRNPCSAQPERTCKNDGTETMNGRVCDKWEITDKKTGTSTVWIDQKLHFPIKSVTADGTTAEFTNIKEGKPDASLFEVPAGYRKLDLGAMGGRVPQ